MQFVQLRELEDLVPTCGECGHRDAGLVLGESDWLLREKPYDSNPLSDDLDTEISRLLAAADSDRISPDDFDEDDDDWGEVEDEDEFEDEEVDSGPLEVDDLLELDCSECHAHHELDAETLIERYDALQPAERLWLESYIDWKRRLRRLLYRNAAVQTPVGAFSLASGFIARNPQTGEEIAINGFAGRYELPGNRLEDDGKTVVELGEMVAQQALAAALKGGEVRLRGIGVVRCGNGEPTFELDPSFEQALRER